MKKIILTITNIIISLAITGGSTTEYIQFNNVKDIMKFECFSCSLEKIEGEEQITQPVYTIVSEKVAEKPEPIKEEKTEKTEPIKSEDNSKKAEPVKKEETSTPEPVKPEPVKEEPQPEPEKTQDSVANGNIINFNNNLNKKGGVETLPDYLKGYADQIMGVCINEDEMTHHFNWLDLSYDDYKLIEQAINKTYFAYCEDGIILSYWDQDGIYLTTNNSKERYNKSLETENNIKSIVNNVVNSSMTEKEAIIAINNYVCDLIEYQESQSDFYVALQTGKGNCKTYACIFKLMCNQCGIECDYIQGYGNTGYHAWNRVYIGGVPYWVDCCWNDGGSNQYLLSADLWGDHSVCTVNQYFYNY